MKKKMPNTMGTLVVSIKSVSVFRFTLTKHNKHFFKANNKQHKFFVSQLLLFFLIQSLSKICPLRKTICQ